MKALTSLIIVLFFSVAAYAQDSKVRVRWNYSGQADGFTIYWGEASNGGVKGWPAGQEVWNGSVHDGNARHYDIDANRFMPQTNYKFQMVAYNSAGPSQPSSIADYFHDVEGYEPPDDSLPDPVTPPDIPPPPHGMRIESVNVQYVPITNEVK